MPLSEHEQRILQEMEQTLRENDREFVARVDHHSHRLDAAKGARWAIVGFVAGCTLMMVTFRFSVALASVGFFIMLIATLVGAQYIHQSGASHTPHMRLRAHPGNGEWSEMRRRMRSRFGHHD
ncbi:MAG: DUF3040 domain-containing protein [Acidimicrobiales bacterium]